MFRNNTTYYIATKSEETLEYLYKYLNSPIADWYYRTKSVQLGERAVRMFSIYMLEIPIPPMIKDIETYKLGGAFMFFLHSQLSTIYPLAYCIHDSNKYEGHTMLPTINEFVSKYGLENFVVVADSGLMNNANIAELETHGYKYIIGAKINIQTTVQRKMPITERREYAG